MIVHIQAETIRQQLQSKYRSEDVLRYLTRHLRRATIDQDEVFCVIHQPGMAVVDQTHEEGHDSRGIHAFATILTEDNGLVLQVLAAYGNLLHHKLNQSSSGGPIDGSGALARRQVLLKESEVFHKLLVSLFHCVHKLSPGPFIFHALKADRIVVGSSYVRDFIIRSSFTSLRGDLIQGRIMQRYHDETKASVFPNAVLYDGNHIRYKHKGKQFLYAMRERIVNASITQLPSPDADILHEVQLTYTTAMDGADGTAIGTCFFTVSLKHRHQYLQVKLGCEVYTGEAVDDLGISSCFDQMSVLDKSIAYDTVYVHALGGGCSAFWCTYYSSAFTLNKDVFSYML